MSGLHFAEPQWIHLLWAVIVFIALLVWLERRQGGDLARFISPALQPRLVARTSPVRRMLRLFFLGLCGLFLTLALMRPQWGVQFVSTPRAGAQIMVALDVSRSMLAEDVAPNRLERAKADLRDLLGWLDGDQVGLIAFAGRASVLSPLTPDFGYLRLVLDEAGPQSVTRGGTRLEEPIRKALTGFRDQGPSEIARTILLITDGEDHDSFPLEAAKAAAERGVRIIAIGFGDEAGSEITVTDPRTGARELLRDADGKPVRSRLDGALLREMALTTGGAYVPAGTGVLDLESIYQRHIAGLTRGRMDGGGYEVHNDAFQWAVLFGLVCLVAAVAVPLGRGRGGRSGGRRALGFAISAVAVAGLVCAPAHDGVSAAEVWAAESAADVVTADRLAGDSDSDSDSVSDNDNDNDNDNDSDNRLVEEETTPRETYNRALADLRDGELDVAARRLEALRANAGTDGELRFRATYNLGWLEHARADGAIEDDPQAALTSLNRSADWFREAIALRPENASARQNLEMVLKRALALADHLAKRDGEDVAARLDRLIAEQRALLGDIGNGVDLAALSDDPQAAPQVRTALRAFAAAQLERLTEAERLSESADQERAAIADKPEDERGAEDAMREAQLGAMLLHLHQARERMGQARGQLRRLQAERAYRRTAAALAALKRARDQLLDPVARLDALVTDGMAVLRETGTKAAADAQPDARAPGWLTLEYLKEAQAELGERTGELHASLEAGLAQAGEAPEDADSQGGALSDQQRRFLARLEAATPLIAEARERFTRAGEALDTDGAVASLEPLGEGLARLAEAREHFLDLKRLVELLHADQTRISEMLAAPEHVDEPQGEGALADEPAPPAPEREMPATTPPIDERTEGEVAGSADPEPSAQSDAQAPLAPEVAEYLPVAAELQSANHARLERVTDAIAERLAAVLDAEEQAAAAADADGAAQPPGAKADPEALAAERERLDQAGELRIQAEQAMLAAIDELTAARAAIENGTGSGPAPDMALARVSVERARELTDALRQLFFSVVDHLRETLRRQLDLGDRTEEVAALAAAAPPEEIVRRAGPLQPEQSSLADRAGQIAEALTKQAEQAPPEQAAAQPSPGQDSAQQQQARLRRAGELVAEARGLMDQAAEGLDAEAPPLDTVRGHQKQAVEALAAALAALEPPRQQQDQEQDEQQQQEQQQQQQASAGEQQQEQDAEPQQSAGDPSQMLQGVRDREAQRRRERSQRQPQGYEPVEKDW